LELSKDLLLSPSPTLRSEKVFGFEVKLESVDVATSVLDVNKDLLTQYTLDTAVYPQSEVRKQRRQRRKK